jgi:16S rRNA (guanine527-N7)-methyltransferase
MPVPAWFSDLLEKERDGWEWPSAEQIAHLYEHYQLLERWSKKINLTSIEAGRELVIRHYCESLFFAARLPDADAGSIADIGSGAGFPGVPIAILKPDSPVTLIESNRRKAVFLREATRGLKNVNVISDRAENLSASYSFLVSRAVNPTEVVALVPRLAPRIGLMLGESDFDALLSVKRIAWLEPIRLPWGDRRLCVFGVSRGTSFT